MPENLAVRADGSILGRGLAPAAGPVRAFPISERPVARILLHSFDDGHLVQCLVEVEPDIFYVATCGKPTARSSRYFRWALWADDAAKLDVMVSATQVRSSGTQVAEIGQLLDNGAIRVLDSTYRWPTRARRTSARRRDTFKARS